MGASIRSGGITYVGVSDQIQSSFNLTHKQLNIFQRTFNSNDLNPVTGVLTCINHYFVTGEEITCSTDNPNNKIGIAATVISGVTTDVLPNTVYIIKNSDSRIRFASTAENALKYNPIHLGITTIPANVTYTITSKKQNTKALVSIDNVIQAPISITSKTTTLNGNINDSTSELIMVDTTQFRNGDIISIDNEIMKISSIEMGGSATTAVSRGFLGTTKSSHSNGATIRKLYGNYNIVGNKIHFVSAPCGVTTDASGYDSRSTFSGRVFLRSGIEDEANQTYDTNYVFDDISDQFINVATEYTLKSNLSDITNIADNGAIVLIKENAQTPSRVGVASTEADYELEETISTTKILFTGSKSQHPYDINASTIPVGGRIVSYGSTGGIGYQPLVAAGATAIILAGSISTISIGGTGSGYRTDANVRVLNDSGETDIIGIVSTSNGHVVGLLTITNPGSGYTTPPQIIIDNPIGYYDIPLKYSSISTVGVGTSATVDLYVDPSGKIKTFEINKNGYGYQPGEILTVGIPTNSSMAFSEFRIDVQEVQTDSFSSWTFGELELLDPFDRYFNGRRKSFQLRKDGVAKSIRAKSSSNIDPQATLLIFINNVLQVPGESYTFTGGSIVTFNEAPIGKDDTIPGSGSTSRVLFYRGTKDIDVIDVDILEEIEPGDYVQVSDDTLALTEDKRTVTEIESTDSLLTNPYPGPGLSLDLTYKRPVEVCKSTMDKFIDGKEANKDRIWYEPVINPTTNIIQSVGIGTTAEIYVESVKTFFDNKKENFTGMKPLTIEVIDQESIKVEKLIAASYQGDFGTIVGIATTTVSPGYETITFDLTIPQDSFLRQIAITNPIVTAPQIQENYYFVITNSNIGNGTKSLRQDGSTISIGTSYVDNVYRAVSVGLGTTSSIIKVTVRVEDYNGLDSQITNPPFPNYFGNYSWGRIYTIKRRNPKDFDFYPTGITGIQTSAIIRRFYPLKYRNYVT